MSFACGAEDGLISVDEALALVRQHTQSLTPETICVEQALNRYLAHDVMAPINLPLFSQSAVDGYAICTPADCEQHTRFDVLGEIRAGDAANFVLKPGQAVRIFTGAPIPFNTTSVARQEIVDLQEGQVVLKEALKNQSDIRYQGEEIQQGQCLAKASQKLHVGAIAFLSMAGIGEVCVVKYPKVAVLISGDEVATGAEGLSEGKIFDANGPLIKAWFEQHNQDVEIIHVADNEVAVAAQFAQLKSHYDVIISTGGVSVGDYDFIRPVALKEGFEQVFWKVKQKPGKPMLFAKYQRSDSSACYLLALPGNPAAVYVAMQVYLSTLLEALQGAENHLFCLTGEVQAAIKPDLRERFLRMSADVEQGRLLLSPLKKQQSHMLSNLMQANCLVRVPAECEIAAGDILKVMWI